MSLHRSPREFVLSNNFFVDSADRIVGMLSTSSGQCLTRLELANASLTGSLPATVSSLAILVYDHPFPPLLRNSAHCLHNAVADSCAAFPVLCCSVLNVSRNQLTGDYPSSLPTSLL